MCFYPRVNRKLHDLRSVPQNVVREMESESKEVEAERQSDKKRKTLTAPECMCVCVLQVHTQARLHAFLHYLTLLPYLGTQTVSPASPPTCAI